MRPLCPPRARREVAPPGQTLRIAVKRVIVNITHNADNLARRLLKARAKSFPDQELLIQWIAAGPESPSHGLVDNHYAWRLQAVTIREIASANERNLENIEIAGRDNHPAARSMRGAVQRPPDDNDWNTVGGSFER